MRISHLHFPASEEEEEEATGFDSKSINK